MVNDTKVREEKTNAYHETKSHSTKMFSYNVYPCTIPQDFYFVSTHWQDSAEVIYIKYGEGIVQVDCESYHAKAGDVFFVMPGHIHGIRHKNRQRMEYENIFFDLSFIGSTFFDVCDQKYWQPLINEKIILPTAITVEHPLNQRIRTFLDASDELCSNRRQGYELGVKGNLLMIFSALFEFSENSTEHQNPNIDKIKQVLQEIENHYDKKMTVEDAALACNYSSSHFMRWFKEMTGTSYTEYLIEYRLGKAAQELKITNDTVLEIAQRTGFENIANFNRLFKKRFGVTPTFFRKQS